MPTKSYGKSLPDQAERLFDLLEAHFSFLGDVRDLYKERVSIERDHATKLQALAKKVSERKAKSFSRIVVGETPTKPWNESAASSTLDKAYKAVLDSLTGAADDHIKLADSLVAQVIDPLKLLETKNEATKKKETQFYQKLLAERDKAYNERTKSKQKYDDECEEVESYRQKQDRADDKHAERAARQLEQQKTDMLNAKNTYLLSISTANKIKERFYAKDLPTFEEHLQILQTRLINRFTTILSHAQTLQIQHADTTRESLTGVKKIFGQVDTGKDQDIYIEHNIRPFAAPDDWVFEPCSNRYDTADVSLEPAAKIFLQNKLIKAQRQLPELDGKISSAERDCEQLLKRVNEAALNHSIGDAEEFFENYLETRNQLTLYSMSRAVYHTQTSCITQALGDDIGGNQPHDFKSSSFSIPTQCGYCKSSIWGLSKQGKTCRQCNLSVHAKCEMNVPADCSGGRSILARNFASSPTSPSIQARPSASVTSETAESTTSEEDYRQAQVLFDFTASSPYELNVSDGEVVHVLEEDDGSGWVKIKSSLGKKGLVPASYIAAIEGEVADTSTTAATLTTESSTDDAPPAEYVRSLYSYTAQGSDELSLKEDEIIQLTAGPTGGKNYADGWWEGVNSENESGIFPSNYVEDYVY